jgi:hypothetical protein
MNALRRILLAASTLAACATLLSVPACNKKPQVGGKCETGRRACTDKKSGLYCADGAWQADTCKGPRGCVEEKDNATCDVTGDEDGDPCPAALDGFGACRADRHSRAQCKAGKYVVEKCRGDEGCTMESAGVSTCDRGIPEPGEKCTADPKMQFCGSGGKVFVTCKDGVYALKQKCPGPNGCKYQGGGLVTCDPNGTFVAGDACHFIERACTADKSAQLECKDAIFVLKSECPGPERCHSYGCDSGYADPASPDGCIKDKRACSLDKKSLLVCKGTTKKTDDGDIVDYKWTIEKPCKTDCTPKDGQLSCD